MIFYILIIAFRGLLDVSYIIFVNPVFEYAGFTLDISFLNYSISWGFYLIALPFVNKKIEVVSDYFFITFVLFVLAPLTSLYGLNDWPIQSVITNVFVFISFCFIVRGNLIKPPKIPTIKYGNYLVIGISIVSILFLLIWYPLSGASFNLDLFKVYEFREENEELASFGFLAYFNNWIYQVFTIFAIGYFLNKKKWILVIIIVLVQVVFYGYSAHKSVLFGLILVFGTWYWYRKSNKAFIVPLGLCGIVILSLFLFVFFDEITLGTLFIRRVFYVPAYLTFKYFEFFGSNDKVFWSNSILSQFIDYPYDKSVPLLIGEFIGEPSASANNGFISSGYAHFGYCGIIFYTIFFAFIVKILDSITKQIDVLWLVLAITITPLRAALISSDLFTTLLTHGLILTVFLVLLMRTKKNVCI